MNTSTGATNASKVTVGDGRLAAPDLGEVALKRAIHVRCGVAGEHGDLVPGGQRQRVALVHPVRL